MRPQLGQIINGKYRLVRLLGDGGMGTVFQAQHEKLGVQVALKFLHSELAKNGGGLVERFLQEARASAQIKSPHVVRVTDVDQTPDGAAFIVLEYLEGKTLQALYEEYHTTGQRLSYGEAMTFALQMVEGLEAAHEANVVHRDLKPENVMITVNGKGEHVLKLLDFGIAKLKIAGEIDRGLTRPGVVMGTPEYMAPEQAYSADGVDARADVFSLGVIVFEMLAGRRPVGGEDPRSIANAYLSGQTAKLIDFVPHVAPDLAEAIGKAMAPLAKDRFATARAFREAIEPFAVAVPASRSGRATGSMREVPSGGSAPMMPPVKLAGPRATVDDGPNANAPVSEASPAGSRGVAKTWPPEDEPSAPAAPGSAGYDATRAMEPLAVGPSATAPGGNDANASPPFGGGAPPAGPRSRRGGGRRKQSASLTTWLLAAACVGLVATGIVFVVTRPSSSSSEDRHDAPTRSSDPQPANTAPAQQDPPAQQPAPQAPPQPQPQPQPAPPPQAQPQPGQPGQARPAGPGQPRPTAMPSGFPSSMPPGMPPGMPGMPPGFPSSMPPGIPGAPTPPPAAPSSPQVPGLPNIPGLPTTLPSFPNPFPTPPPPPG